MYLSLHNWLYICFEQNSKEKISPLSKVTQFQWKKHWKRIVFFVSPKAGKNFDSRRLKRNASKTSLFTENLSSCSENRWKNPRIFCVYLTDIPRNCDTMFFLEKCYFFFFFFFTSFFLQLEERLELDLRATAQDSLRSGQTDFNYPFLQYAAEKCPRRIIASGFESLQVSHMTVPSGAVAVAQHRADVPSHSRLTRKHTASRQYQSDRSKDCLWVRTLVSLTAISAHMLIERVISCFVSPSAAAAWWNSVMTSLSQYFRWTRIWPPIVLIPDFSLQEQENSEKYIQML